MKRITLFAALAALFIAVQSASACTGITLRTSKGEIVVARTIEWALQPLNSQYVIVPRGHSQRALLAQSPEGGLRMTARFGYVGLAVEQPEFIAEGMNERGLSAGLFYFPAYGEYVDYDASQRERTINDFQVVAWMLGSFESVDEAIEGLKGVNIVGIDPRSSTVHWRIADRSGRQVVVEIIGKKMKVYENTLGVLTNAPSFDWHLTNLNNYVNLLPGSVHERKLGNITLHAFGAGTGLVGLPGDMTPSSRFVRAAFLQSTAPEMHSAEQAAAQAFHILNNFDAPIGMEFTSEEHIPDMPSVTQWTVASDLTNGRLYYRTMYNSQLRYIDLSRIDFAKVKYRYAPLDKEKKESMIEVKI